MKWEGSLSENLEDKKRESRAPINGDIGAVVMNNFEEAFALWSVRHLNVWPFQPRSSCYEGRVCQARET